MTSESLERMRADGWAVAVHNDYRLNGEPHTFWLFTHPDGRWIKGEGCTDAEAIEQAVASAARPPAQGVDLGKLNIAPAKLGNTPTVEVLRMSADMLDEAARRLGGLVDMPVNAKKLRALAQALATPSSEGEGEAVAEKLRAAWMRVQAAKRDGKPGLQPLWDVVNLVPYVLYALDNMATFEREIEAEDSTPSPVSLAIGGDHEDPYAQDDKFMSLEAARSLQRECNRYPGRHEKDFRRAVIAALSPQGVQETVAKVRDTTRIPACDLTEAEMRGELKRVEALWDGMMSDPDFEGHSGSPGEGMVERLGEIRTELSRRAPSGTSHV